MRLALFPMAALAFTTTVTLALGGCLDPREGSLAARVTSDASGDATPDGDAALSPDATRPSDTTAPDGTAASDTAPTCVGPGCPAECGPSGCDDGDRCTRGTCGADGLCRYEAIADCAPECRRQGVARVDDVRWRSPGDAATVAGAVVPDPGTRSCGDAGRCTARAAVDDGSTGWVLPLAPGAGAPWTCRERLDPPAARCAPLDTAARYLFWGTLVADEPPAPGSAPPPRRGGGAAWQPVALAVAGTCLETTPEGLTGRYRGWLRYGFPELDRPVTAEVLVAAGGDVVMRVSGICEGCGDAATQLAPLRLLDGEVALELRVPDLFGDLIRVAATLAAHDNYLTGAFAVSVAGREDPAEDEPWPPTGVLSLERVLPAETF